MSDRYSFATPLWRSLRHRNYRLYLTGQLVSVCGTWMQQVAQSWLVYRLTGSATLLGIVGFATQIPVFGLGPIAGVIIDRYSPHRVTVLTQSAALVQALLLSLLTLMGWVQPAHIILLGFVLGIVNAFDMPARQALVNQMVEAKDLSNAVALNSSMINAARIVGPGLAGIVVARVGEGACFTINAVSYLAVIMALLAMKLPKKSDESARQFSIAHSLVEGLRYTLATVPIRDVLLLLGLVGFMGMPYMTLMPVFAAEIHKSGADALGLMLGAVGFGALIGALFLAQRATVLGLGRIIVVATLGFGLGLIVFTVSRVFWLSLVILMGVGFGWMVLIAASNTALQTLADNEMRGRVMSLFSMMLVGMAPFGSLLAGWLADRIGAPLVVATGGAFCAVAGVIFARELPRLRAAARPILVARGIIVDPTAGDEATGIELR
ncbi:MAG: MFS transporter [Deltaproteobacteria bacterium 13_1_40CM_4_54_4]|nr:MAG: MFS transporter [Deltaproteobacteria bacterium 13_1_40CM_4_54_4]